MATNPRSEEKATEAVQQAAQQAAQAARETNRKGAEQTARITQAAVDANGHVARAGAEIMQRNAEAVHHAMQSSTEMAARLAERSAAQLSHAMTFSGDEAQQAVRQSSSNVVAMLQSGAALADVTQSLWLETANFARDCMEHNFDRFDHLLRCRSPQDFVTLQSEAVKENFGGLLACLRKMAERSMQMTEEATRKLNDHMDSARRVA